MNRQIDDALRVYFMVRGNMEINEPKLISLASEYTDTHEIHFIDSVICISKNNLMKTLFFSLFPHVLRTK